MSVVGEPAVSVGDVAARLDVRVAGYCVHCDRIVERRADGSCPNGHPSNGVAGRVVLAVGEPVPALPRFNVAAFLLPPIWGPAHGQWAGAIFLPLWLFADSTLRTAGHNTETMVAGAVVSAGTLGAMAWFGKRANGLAWRSRWATVTVAEYVNRERAWAMVAVPVAAALFSAAVYFDMAMLNR